MRKSCFAVLPLAALAFAALPAQAQPVMLSDSVTAFGPGVTVLGAAPADATVSFQVALRLRDKTDLDARVARGERLSASQLAATHLPTPGAYQAVRSWLTGQGLTVDRDTGDRLMIEAHGTVAQVSRALGISFEQVSAGGQTFVAAQQAPAIPPSIAAYVSSINGLQPYQQMEPVGFVFPGPGATGQAAAAAAGVSPGITITGNYYPGGILRAYKAEPYLTESGLGTRTAILISTLPHISDVAAFYKLIGSSQTTKNIEFVKVASGTLPPPSGEETLDTEWASGIGFQSKVRVYATGTLQFTALDTGFHAILKDLSAGLAINQLSISLGACEASIAAGQIRTDNSLLESIAAQGVSIFVATGDKGAQECGPGNGLHPAFYSTSPYVTAVGATHLIVTAKSETSPKVTIKSETAWSLSGGGISGVFAKPSYQSSLKYSNRAVPDVAAVGDPATGVDIVLDGSVEEVGGTSASTPIWAGLTSLANQARFAAKLPELGLLNPRIYPLLGTANFRDIVKGDNGGYKAGPGYDLTTGIGTPVMNHLVPTLMSQP